MPEGGGRRTMALVYVHCPECQSIDVVQYGKQANGTQRYRCNNRDCPRTIFLLQYSDKGRLPAVKQQIVDMTLNGSGKWSADSRDCYTRSEEHTSELQ